MKVNELGNFKVSGSIDTQWRTNLAVERILIASGQKVNGITSFLTTLEFIGNILLILLSLFIITTILTIEFLLWLVRSYYFIKTAIQERNTLPEIEKSIETGYSDEEIIQLLKEESNCIGETTLYEFQQRLEASDFFGPDYDKFTSLKDSNFVYDERTGIVILANFSCSLDSGKFLINKATRFALYSLSANDIAVTFSSLKTKDEEAIHHFNSLCPSLKIGYLLNESEDFGFDDIDYNLTMPEISNYLASKENLG